MTKYISVFGIALAFVTLELAVDEGNQALAMSGCCKKRDSNSSPWRKIGTDLGRCKVENRKDGDNVFKKSGLVWWDMSC